ncbi:hypothetical protein ONZ45_g17792 [Pleurotus djamor]|nr:hypothetical protein ONZ45_g17792 [Pleurotus djamor]
MIGFHVILQSSMESASAIASFLEQGSDLTKDEAGTLQWIAAKFSSSSEAAEFLIIDTFSDEAGRQAHLQGQCGAEFGKQIPPLVSAPPALEPVVYLASKVVPNAPITCGLQVMIQAKPGSVDAVRNFLVNALPSVEAEPDTLLWYAIEFPGKPGVFAIVDGLPSESGRKTHLEGKVAAALFGEGLELLSTSPNVKEFEIISAKSMN